MNISKERVRSSNPSQGQLSSSKSVFAKATTALVKESGNKFGTSK